MLPHVPVRGSVNHSTPGLPSITNSRSSPKLMSFESVMPSNHLILCRPLLCLPLIPLSIRVLSNESTFRTGESGLVLSEEGNPAGLSSCSGGLRPLFLPGESHGQRSLVGYSPGGGSAPSCCAFTHRVAFEEGSGPRVLLKSGTGNRGAFGMWLSPPRKPGLPPELVISVQPTGCHQQNPAETGRQEEKGTTEDEMAG